MTVSNNIDVNIVPHPFAVERVQHSVEAGLSISAIIAQLQPDPWLARHAHVYLNGDYIPPPDWPRVKPKAGTQLSIRLVPMGGGGGKSPLRTIMSIAIMAGTAEIGGMFAGETFMGIGLGKIFGAGFSLVGKLLLNALAPPPKPRFALSVKQSPTLFLQAAQNQASQFMPVPIVLGQHRYVPPLGAQPYTETVGGDQYLRMLFVWGYGPINITDLKIGETPIEDFDDVQIETRQGYPDDGAITLYTDSVIQDDLQVSLTNAGGYMLRTTDTDADEISVDITFPQGLFQLNMDGSKSAASVDVSVDYAPAGSGDWTNAGTISVTALQTVALLEGLQFAVTRGQYDVRLKRVTPDSTSDLVYDDVTWTALRTIRYTQPINMTGLAMTALRIKATDQLNGVIDKLNGVVQSILPDWNGTAWVAGPTSNPASIYRAVLQGTANARPLADSRLDLDRLQTWHDDCVTADREFNAVIDYSVSVSDVLQDVAAAGRASPMLIDGLWSIVEDKPQTVPIQHFTPRNTYSFQGNKAFTDLPQALRVRFINRDNGWLQDEQIVYDDGYNATNTTQFEVLELPGITSATQAWKDGRYHIATARLRPETYSFCADIEHIVCTRGDLIRFTHDVPLFGLMSGRVKLVTVVDGLTTAVTLDAAVTMVAGQSYAARFRLSDGSSLVQSLTTIAGTGNVLTFTTPGTGPAVGDLALFGESGQESVELIVKSITPQNDLSALLVCVDAAPAVFTAEDGDIPTFNSQITVPPEMLRPPVPVLSQIQSGQTTLILNADGSVTNRIVITLQPPSYTGALDINVLIRAQGTTNFIPATVMSQTGNSVSIIDVSGGAIYDLQVYYASTAGTLSAALTIPGYQVQTATVVPSDVTNFNINVLDSTAYLSWSPVTDIDLAYYTLRFAPQTSGVTWSSATDLVSRISKAATSVTVPAAVGTYLIKAVDAAGRLSTNADLVVSTIAGLSGQNAVLSIDEDPVFAGAMTNVGIGDGVLQLSGKDSIDDWPDIDHVLNADIGNDGLAVAGTYGFYNSIDLGAVYTSRLTLDMAVSGIDTTTSVDTWADVDNQESWDQSVDPSLWNVQLQLRSTNDNPSGSPVWSGWMPFVIGDYSARAFQFQALLTSDLAGITPAVTQLQVDLTMPDRTERDNNIVAPSGGMAVAFGNPFRVTPAIAITAQNMATGDYYTITSPSASGFTIHFFNAGNAGISRTFDYLASGYGEKI